MPTILLSLLLLCCCFFQFTRGGGFLCKKQQQQPCSDESKNINGNILLISNRNIVVCDNCSYKIQYNSNRNEVDCYTENSLDSIYKFNLDAVPNCEDDEDTIFPTDNRGIVCKASPTSGCPLGIESKEIGNDVVCHNCRYRMDYNDDAIKCYTENSSNYLYPFLLGALPFCDTTAPSLSEITNNNRGMMCQKASSEGCPLGVDAIQIDGTYYCHNCRYQILQFQSNKQIIKCYTENSADGEYQFLLDAVPSCDNVPEEPSTFLSTERGIMCKTSSSDGGCPLGVDAIQIKEEEYLCHNCHHKVEYDATTSDNTKIKCYTEDSLNGLYPFLYKTLPQCNNAPIEPTFPNPTTYGMMCKASSDGCPLGIESIRINNNYYCHNCHYTIKYDDETDETKCYTENASSKLYPFLLGAVPDCDNAPTEPSFLPNGGKMCKASSLGCPLGVNAVQIDGGYICHNCNEAVEYDTGDPGQIDCRTMEYALNAYSFSLCALPDCDNLPPLSAFPTYSPDGVVCKASPSFGCPFGIASLDLEDDNDSPLLLCHNCHEELRTNNILNPNEIECRPTSSSMSTFYLNTIPFCYTVDENEDTPSSSSFPYCSSGQQFPSSCTRSCFPQSKCLFCPGKCHYNSEEGGCLQCGSWTPTNPQCSSSSNDDDDEPTALPPTRQPVVSQSTTQPVSSSSRPTAVSQPVSSPTTPDSENENNDKNNNCIQACLNQSGCPSCNNNCRYNIDDGNSCLQCGDWTPNNQQCSEEEDNTSGSSNLKKCTTLILLGYIIIQLF